MKKILQVFNTATDAYLEYVNNFITIPKFIEHFNLDESEVNMLLDAAKEVKENHDVWLGIDYYFTKATNNDYSEKDIHW